MGKRVYLHIGWEKTGTSAIQVFCARNQGWLNDRGVHYPLMGELPQHADLYWDLISGDASRVERSSDAVRAQIDACDQDAVIFSHESLHLFAPKIFAKMFQGHEVRVIAYVRQPDVALISFFMTMVRYGLVGADDLFRAVRGFGREHVGRFAYTGALMGFVDQFGRASVTVRQYAPDALVGGQAVTDFMHLLGIDDLDGSKWPDDRSNVSLDADQFAVVLRVARALRGMPEAEVRARTRRLCDAMLAAGEPDRSRRAERFVPASLRRRLLACWRESFGALYDEFFDGRAIFDDGLAGLGGQPYVGMDADRLEALVAVVRQADVLPVGQAEGILASLQVLRC
ncbi:MAG: hypothetical protein ACF8K1_10545 [Phycisphaerales bacterium JB047]